MYDIEFFNLFFDFFLELNLEEILSLKKVEFVIFRVSLNMICVNVWLNFVGCVKKWLV